MSENHPKELNLHITKLSGFKLPAEVKAMMGRDLKSGKGYDACHRLLRKETGIWIPELEQVFKDLDSMLGR